MKIKKSFSDELDEDYLIELANLRGKDVKIEDIDFSIFFSRKIPNHGCRVKICWNRDKMTNEMGNLEAHGDYKYTQNSSYKKPSNYDIEEARYFVKKYKVLFAAVWEEKLDQTDVCDYFRGLISWQKLMTCFQNVSEQDFERLRICYNRKDLEDCVRRYHIFNMND